MNSLSVIIYDFKKALAQWLISYFVEPCTISNVILCHFCATLEQNKYLVDVRRNGLPVGRFLTMFFISVIQWDLNKLYI